MNTLDISNKLKDMVNKYHENYKEEIEELDLPNNVFPLEDARILWKVNRQGKITEIEVVRFPKNDIEKWPVHLHELYSFDIGNSELGWEENYTLAILLMKFFHDYGFAHKDVADKFLKDLSSIIEFKLEIETFFLRRLA